MSAVATTAPVVPVWRHLRAIALLPFMNTVLIPAAILVAWPPALPSGAIAEWLVRASGLALAAAGVALAAHSIGGFVRSGGGTLAPWDPTRALVSAGAYAYTRNPMKAGLFAVLAGEALLTLSLPLAVWLAAFALVNVVYIRVSEEPGLRKRFGRAYLDYCERVPRWIPRFTGRSIVARENYP
jgi:protein-S-isoprenylcysteine O-methyltransferase Ste14